METVFFSARWERRIKGGLREFSDDGELATIYSLHINKKEGIRREIDMLVLKKNEHLHGMCCCVGQESLVVRCVL